MAKNLSAQALFSAPAFDDKYILQKAERELARLSATRDDTVAYDHMMNFSVTIASLSDWVFHIHCSDLPEWKNKDEKYFTRWVRKSSDEAYAFIEIANEYKHANRTKPNTVVEHMGFSTYNMTKHGVSFFGVDMTRGWIMSTGTRQIYIFPSVKVNGKIDSFYAVAERAIAWWKEFDPTNARPTDAKGNFVA